MKIALHILVGNLIFYMLVNILLWEPFEWLIDIVLQLPSQ